VEHSYLDAFADRKGPLQRLNARTKLAGALALILASSLLPPERTWPFAAYLVLLAALFSISRLPAAVILKRLAAFAPFILAAAALLPFTRPGNGAAAAKIRLAGAEIRLYDAGLLAAKGVALKSLISALSVILLVSTTHFARLLRALERWRVPRLILTMIALLYRYLFLLLGELLRLNRAARARNWEAGRLRTRLKATGGILGSLFLRAHARGERVHLAMLARGYDGHARTPDDTIMTPRDWAVLGCFLAAVLGVLIGGLLPRLTR